MLSMILVFAAAAVGGGLAYLLGYRHGQRMVADEMIGNPEVGRRVLERLAKVHGAKLELFETAGP